MRNLILLFVVLSIAASNQAQIPQHKLSIEFKGNKIFESDTLLKKLNFCLAKYSDSQDTYDARLIEYCLHKDVLGFLQMHGYLSANIDEPKVKDNGQTLTISVDEGKLYRLGNIKIQGSKVFSPEQLLEKLTLKTGYIANSQELRQWLFERVKNLYADNGYIQSDFDLDTTFKSVNEKDAIIDLKVIVIEGQRFTVSRIEFVGNAQTSDELLRSALLIKEDEPYSQKRLNESIEKLNSLGLFERIDKDKDVEFRSDTESPLLNIKIRVKETKH